MGVRKLGSAQNHFKLFYGHASDARTLSVDFGRKTLATKYDGAQLLPGARDLDFSIACRIPHAANSKPN
jgi:hypothetical protein